MLYTFNNGTKKKFTDIYTFLNGTKYKFHTMYTYIDGEKKYLLMPKTVKPGYWISYDTKVNVESSYRTYYKINLDGSTSNESFVYNFGYQMGSESNNPLLSGHKFDSVIQRAIIYHSNCNTATQGVENTMFYRIYDANMHLIKELTHPVTWPISYSSSVYNNTKHLLLTMFSGFNNNGTTEILNPRYLRIVDLVNLRILTKSFIWPNGKQGQVIGSWYDANTKKLRVLCKDWYDTTGFPVLQNQAMAIAVYDVNLTTDEYDLNPVFTYKFNTLAQPYWSYWNAAIPYSWDSPVVSFNPCSGTASINNKTRPVSNVFYFYNFTNNTIWSTSHTQSYSGSGTDSAGAITVSPNGSNFIAMYLKWLDLAKTDTVLYRWSSSYGLTTPTNAIGQRWTNASYIQSWNNTYCFCVSASDTTAGVGKVALYWTDNNNAYNYYNPVIYESTSGNPISSTSTGSIGSNASSPKYLAINKKENSSGINRYMNVIDKDNIYNTMKLDLTTNTVFPGWKSWSGFFVY